MKIHILALALAASALGALAANAQTAVIEERHDPPAVVIEHDHPDASVTIKEHGVRGERKVIKKETTGAGIDCDSKTVHKEGPEGSTTVHKTRCD